MTLCKYRPVRTYDAQYIFEQNDVNGLMKLLRDAVPKMAAEDLPNTKIYLGALLALEVLFGCAESDGMVDTWLDFAQLFDAAINDYSGKEE